MRIGSVLAIVGFGSLMAIAGSGAASAASTTRHAGTVETVDSKAQAVVIREVGANGHVYDLRVHLAPNAPIMLSERNARATDVQHEFTNTAIQLTAVRPGDFVVVDMTGHGVHARGESMMVTFRAGR